MPAWFYMLRLSSGSFYSGASSNLEKRISNHFSGRGCRTTKIDKPIALVYTKQFDTMQQALHREQQVKRWTHAKKEALINGDFMELKRLAKCKNSNKH
ncbi:MAG: GIY-YIG nuclease family protein [Bacteroidetes bacterium]|nr:GIY-YIG nuclease family protein [Bacteroidota bacterium]